MPPGAEHDTHRGPLARVSDGPAGSSARASSTGLALTLAIEIGSSGLVLGGRGTLLLPIVIAMILAVGVLAAVGPAGRGLSVQPTEMLRARVLKGAEQLLLWTEGLTFRHGSVLSDLEGAGK